MVRLAVVVVAAFLITGTMGTLAVNLPPGAALPQMSLPAAAPQGPVPPPTNANYVILPTAQTTQPAQPTQPAQSAQPPQVPAQRAYIRQTPYKSLMLNSRANVQQGPGVMPQPGIMPPRPPLQRVSLPRPMPRRPSRPPRRRTSPARKLLSFMGQIRAALDFECKTVRDMLGLDIPRFIPIKCDDKCFLPTVCRNVGPLGFCCPFYVTDQMIQAYGVIETYKLLG